MTKKGDKVDYQHARNRTFLEKIGDRIVNGFQKVQTTVMDVIDPIMETGESFLGIEDDQNTLQVRILGILGQLKSRMPASISVLLLSKLTHL